MPLTSFSKARIGIYSLSRDAKNPLPHYEFNLNSFRDPMNKKLFTGAINGSDDRIKEWVKEDQRFSSIMKECDLLAADQKANHGSSWLTIGFRDFHGKWKSRAVSEIIADHLSNQGYDVCLFHMYVGGEGNVEGL